MLTLLGVAGLHGISGLPLIMNENVSLHTIFTYREDKALKKSSVIPNYINDKAMILWEKIANTV